MTYRHITFPIQLGRSIDPLILAARTAVADVFRSEARASISRANEAGIDQMAQGQRMVMSYMQACQGSRFLRAFPAAVARWCFGVEVNTPYLSGEGYPVAPYGTVGGQGVGWITPMPHNVVLINAGGVRASGVLNDGDAIALHEVREVRLTRAVDLDNVVGYTCTVIMGSDTSPRLTDDDPVIGEPVEQEDL